MRLNIQIVAASALMSLLLCACNQQTDGTSAPVTAQELATQSVSQVTTLSSTNDMTAPTNGPSTSAIDQSTNTTDRSGLRETAIATSTNALPTAPPLPVTPQ